MKQKPQTLADFFKACRKTYHSSQGDTIAAERMNIVQSDRLQLFTRRERTGQPLKSSAWRAVGGG